MFLRYLKAGSSVNDLAQPIAQATGEKKKKKKLLILKLLAKTNETESEYSNVSVV